MAAICKPFTSESRFIAAAQELTRYALASWILWHVLLKLTDIGAGLPIMSWWGLGLFDGPAGVLALSLAEVCVVVSMLLLHKAPTALLLGTGLVTLFSVVLLASAWAGYTGECGCGSRRTVDESLRVNAAVAAIASIAVATGWISSAVKSVHSSPSREM